jgi:hypothetical protein
MSEAGGGAAAEGPAAAGRQDRRTRLNRPFSPRFTPEAPVLGPEPVE